MVAYIDAMCDDGLKDCVAGSMAYRVYNDIKYWINNLCPQYHWKPSEEQMKALKALNCHGDLSYAGQQNQLISLYNDLKKLIKETVIWQKK